MDIAIWDKSVTKAVHDLLTDVKSDTVSVAGAKVFAVYQLVEAVAPNGVISLLKARSVIGALLRNQSMSLCGMFI